MFSTNAFRPRFHQFFGYPSGIVPLQITSTLRRRRFRRRSLSVEKWTASPNGFPERTEWITKTTTHVRRFRRCGKSRRTSAAVHSGAPEARDERKRYYGRRRTTIADDMPDTKRTRTRFLNYVNAFNNGLLRDQTAITSPPPGFHWSLVENAARRVPFENRSDGGLAAVVTDPPAFSRNRFSSSRNHFLRNEGMFACFFSRLCLIFVTMFYRGTALRLKLRGGRNWVRKASFLLFFYARD